MGIFAFVALVSLIGKVTEKRNPRLGEWTHSTEYNVSDGSSFDLFWLEGEDSSPGTSKKHPTLFGTCAISGRLCRFAAAADMRRSNKIRMIILRKGTGV